MKRILTLLLCLMPMLINGIIRHVALDGTQQYTVIQNAINDAISGDVVLVHPGRYYENLNLSDKTGIALASLEYTTNDTTYISSTIIDGSSNANSTILCLQNTVSCTIRGLSITGGSGYDYFNGTSPYQIFGGGIFIYYNCSMSLINLSIYGNKTSCGGGICILSPCTVNMSNVNLFNNIARYRGGGLSIGSDTNGGLNLIFDQSNRCSIYNNFAQWGMDIDWAYIHGGSISVYLKKFTVPLWERYYADFYDSYYPPSPYTIFDIQESYLQEIDADLYVSPDGSDFNDGLSSATALKTPSLAMQRIASNPSNPRIVNLMAGEHHNIMRGEYLTIAIKDYTILKGLSQSQTRLYAEDLIQGTGVVTMGIERYGMALKDISITADNCSAVFSWGIHGGLFENITIENSSTDRWTFSAGYITSKFKLKNITIRNSTAAYHDYGFHLTGSVIEMDNITMTDCGVFSNPGFMSRGPGGLEIGIADTLIIRNSKFVNNTLYSEDGFANFRAYTDPTQFSPYVLVDNCLFAHNHAYDGVRDVQISSMGEINIINSTFANNTTSYTDNLLVWADSTYIINSLFANNNALYEIRADNTTLIENCLFSRTNNIWRTYDNQPPLTWGQNNLVGVNPLFSGSDPTQPSYYYLFSDEVNGFSPAINAGTLNYNILPPGYLIPEYDAFGNNRIYGGSIDIGCFESPGYTYNCDPVVVPSDRLELNNYPNPFNESTKIKYTLPMDGEVKLYIYNVKGQFIKKLVSNSQSKGEYQVNWNGKDQNGKQVSAGIYFCRLETLGKAITGKMLLLK